MGSEYMNSKLMLLECINCKETYLADDKCDGYNCPKCNGHIVPRGFIEKMEESIKETQYKIKKAKGNGLIRNYYKYHIPPKPEGPPSNYVGGVDLGSGKDHTIIINTNNPYIDKDKIVAEIMEKLNDPRSPRRSGAIG
jgi:DNA-directed RNA polymerase subunit RPC12/RpoP